MDQVPVTFIESVFRSFRKYDRKEVGKLPPLWRQVGEAWRWRSGRLSLTFSCGGLYYTLEGWPHIRTRTLSREVVSEMAKNISSVELRIRPNFLASPLIWEHIPRAEEHNVMQLLRTLNAPLYRLENLEWLPRMFPRDSDLLKRFNSLAVHDDLELLDQMISLRKLQFITISGNVPAQYDAKDLVDYFLSESCESLSAHFEDVGVVLQIINQWKEIDPQYLAPGKVLKGLHYSCKQLTHADMIPMYSIDRKLYKKIQRTVRSSCFIESLCRIEHPADPARRIYILFLKLEEFLFKQCCILLFE
uniref:F-box domain-containing protein n=1 Tax=Steinernema glaseri TaxID=37863 RepID=A0A1I8AJB0_9BILA